MLKIKDRHAVNDMIDEITNLRGVRDDLNTLLKMDFWPYIKIRIGLCEVVMHEAYRPVVETMLKCVLGQIVFYETSLRGLGVDPTEEPEESDRKAPKADEAQAA
jgi:hypothetical protein